jgi:hypothetical protein
MIRISAIVNTFKFICALIILFNFLASLHRDQLSDSFKAHYIYKYNYFLSRDASPIKTVEFKEQKRLIQYLRENLKDTDYIYTVGSSGIFNRDIITNGEAEIFGRDSRKLHVLGNPDVDARDKAPYDTFLEANVFLVATPVQTHLAANSQKSVTSVFSLFSKNIRNNFFYKDPQTFHFNSQTEVSIWKVKNKSNHFLVDKLRSIKSSLKESSVPDQNWSALHYFGNFSSGIKVINNKETSFIVGHVGNSKNKSSYIYFGSASKDYSKLKGVVSFPDNRCQGALIELTSYTNNGKLIQTTSKKVEKYSTHEDFTFNVKLQSDGFAIINLLPAIDNINYCSIIFENLEWI